ncbi:MAG: M42 family metallopeptidase [Victivallaceae bacterium]|nr:M42 family metallopeptidase [Victivallaceae bacterium]MDD3704194.1 M42 family metallopeptidase [Victivallaceae bacterium]MDD4317768.1 M42 family metallopeptidase [Victivallaceae bacterium]MDD5664110.1 M42 family metallopeptidase [Victivallaceae bacterium]NLK83383.1 M42 family metallopeptidase [Lentisphaerota bacterium]
MISAESLKFMKNLMMCSGPSGYELEAAAVFRAYLSDFSHKVYTDVMGNTTGVLNPDAKFRVMLAGHYDEIGFQVVYISDEGLLYFRPNGGIDKLTVPGLEVEVLTAKKRIRGVIGKKPIHLLTPKEREVPPELSDLWIDIGAENRAEAEKIVKIGDPVAFVSNFRRIGNNRIMSKGMDDKVGAFIVAETLRELSKRKLKVGVYAVGTVQEELGLRGAITSSFDVAPKAAFTVDVGFATDIPDVQKKILGEIKLGSGPELTSSADNNIVLGKMIRRIADKHKIPYQETAAHRASGGTDTAQIQLSRSGVATALISIPNRYMHSPVEICDLRDVEGAIAIMTETIASMTGKESFIPGID